MNSKATKMMLIILILFTGITSVHSVSTMTPSINIYELLELNISDEQALTDFYVLRYGEVARCIIEDGITVSFESYGELNINFIHLYMAMVEKETNYHYTKSIKENKNGTNDWGYTQVNDIHFYSTNSRRVFFKGENLNRPVSELKQDLRLVNRVGARILYHNITRYKGDYNGLVVYNAGSGRFVYNSVPASTYRYTAIIIGYKRCNVNAFDEYYAVANKRFKTLLVKDALERSHHNNLINEIDNHSTYVSNDMSATTENFNVFVDITLINREEKKYRILDDGGFDGERTRRQIV